MQLFPKATTWRKSILLYRGIRYRKGYGVHSPFVYNLITKVIGERCPYYSFYDIELVRRQLLQRDTPVTYPDRRKKGKFRTRTVGQIAEREGIKAKHGALLFRLTNHFKSKQILQLGTSMGISTLYLTSCAPDIRCIALENIPAFASIARTVFEKAARNPVDLRTGSLRELLPQALKDMEKIDFLFFNTLSEPENNDWLFETCLKKAGEETVFVFEGIRSNRQMRMFWQNVCRRPEVTVTIDLYSMGIVFFNKRLHKKDYIVYF